MLYIYESCTVVEVDTNIFCVREAIEEISRSSISFESKAVYFIAVSRRLQ